MRIAQVVSTFPPYHGGMGNMAYSYALGLSRMGHQVDVFCPAFCKVEREIEAPFRIHRLKPWGKVRNSAFLPQLFTRLGGFDIVNLHYPFYGGAEVVYLMKLFRRSRFKLVVTFHMDNFGTGIMGLLFRMNAAHLTPLILRSADRIIVTSFDYAANSAAAKVFKEAGERFVEIPPGVDTERFKPADKSISLLSRYGIKKEEKIVLFVGGLDRAHSFKGIDFLLDAWRVFDHSGTRLLIVGEGDLKKEYVRRAIHLGISESVIFADPVDDQKLSEYYNMADLLVLPSMNSCEAFGIVIIEAMSCGVPVIASDLPGVRKAVQNGSSGLVFRIGDRTDLLNKMKTMLSNREQFTKYKENARESAVSLYSLSTIWAKVEKVFCEACQS